MVNLVDYKVQDPTRVFWHGHGSAWVEWQRNQVVLISGLGLLTGGLGLLIGGLGFLLGVVVWQDGDWCGGVVVGKLAWGFLYLFIFS